MAQQHLAVKGSDGFGTVLLKAEVDVGHLSCQWSGYRPDLVGRDAESAKEVVEVRHHRALGEMCDA